MENYVAPLFNETINNVLGLIFFFIFFLSQETTALTEDLTIVIIKATIGRTNKIIVILEQIKVAISKITVAIKAAAIRHMVGIKLPEDTKVDISREIKLAAKVINKVRPIRVDIIATMQITIEDNKIHGTKIHRAAVIIAPIIPVAVPLAIGINCE